MNKYLMTALIDCCLFCELSSDDVVDPDAAIELMEQVGYTLQHLDPEEKKELIAFAAEMADEQAATPGREEVVNFLRTFSQFFGLEAELYE